MMLGLLNALISLNKRSTNSTIKLIFRANRLVVIPYMAGITMFSMQIYRLISGFPNNTNKKYFNDAAK